MGVLLFLLSRAGEYLAENDPQGPTDAALVFSGDPGFERTKEAVRLYKEKRVKKLILTGLGGPGDGALSLGAVAVKKGVLPEDILMENRSTSTYTNILNSREIILSQGFTSIALVSSPYHMRRIRALVGNIFRGDRIKFFCHPVGDSFWVPDRWWKSSEGRRPVIYEYEKLVALWVFGAVDGNDEVILGAPFAHLVKGIQGEVAKIPMAYGRH